MTRDNPVTDPQLAAHLLPLLAELENRMVARDHAGQAARVVQLRTYLMCDFGVDKTLAAPKDTKTRPMFDDGAPPLNQVQNPGGIAGNKQGVAQ